MSRNTPTIGNFSFKFLYAHTSAAAHLYLETGLPELMTVQQVALILQVNSESVRRWETRGLIKASRIKRGQREDRHFDKKEVLRILSQGLLSKNI